MQRFLKCPAVMVEISKAVGDTYRIINEKIEMEMEIRTLLTANKNELNIMMLMPLIIMVTLSGWEVCPLYRIHRSMS